MRLIPFVVLSAVAMAAWACGGSPTGPIGAATLNLRITDGPFADAQAVLVTFSEVQVHRVDEAWEVVPFVDGASRTCDLKKLENGAEDVLGVGALTPGHYTQLRLVVDHAELFFEDDSGASLACAPSIVIDGPSEPLEIPSGEVKLNRQFELTAEDATTILLDFDGEKSIRQTSNGRYRMTPVIGIVSVQ